MSTPINPTNNPDISGLVAYGGDYKLPLLAKLFFEMNLEKEGIFIMGGMKNKTNLHKMLVKKGLKPFTGKFNAKQDISFEPRTIEVLKAQRDLQITPSDYISTFAAYLRGLGENAANLAIPFAQFMWEQVMKENANEIVTETVYNGVGKAAFTAHNPSTGYSVGALITYVQNGELCYYRCIETATAGQNPDTHSAKWDWAGARALTRGYNAIIADEISANKIVPVSTGAITSTDAYSQFTTMWRRMPEQIRNSSVGANIYCSQTNYEALVDSYETQTKQFQQVNGVTVLPKTEGKCRIRPVSWLSGSGRLIATMNNNLVMGTDATSDMSDIKIMPQMYHLDAGLSFMIGFQIQDLDVLRVNDQN